MRIFLSYDDTRRDVAERLALGLRTSGHEVFFDQDSLPAGTSYDDRIRNAILRSHLFVFLISRESIAKGAYALTELAIAEHRWPHPTGRVLPVLLDDTPITTLQPYLRAVSVLIPRGDVVAEALHAARLRADLRRRSLRKAAIATGAVAAVLAVIVAVGHLRDGATSGVADGTPGNVAADSAQPADTSPVEPVNVANQPTADEVTNAHTWKLKNDRHVRLIGDIVSNDSNVADTIIRDGVEWSAWRYNRCYDDAYGHLAADLPEGAVVIEFEIADQLPRRAVVQRSDFASADFNECIVGTLLGQTLNAAGATGAGGVAYSFRFLPN